MKISKIKTSNTANYRIASSQQKKRGGKPSLYQASERVAEAGNKHGKNNNTFDRFTDSSELANKGDD